MSNNKTLKDILILVILSTLFFMAGNGILGLTNDNEVFYAQSAKEMITHHTWLTPYLFDQPQFEKPIFIYWVLRLGFEIFGVSNFSARFFPAIFGVLGVIAVYCLSALGFSDKRKAFLSGVVLASMGMYFGMAKTVFTDMVFTAFLFLSLLSFFWAYTKENKKALGFVLFGAFCALAVLTKGPLGLILPGLAVFLFLICTKKIKFLFCWQTLLGLFIFAAISVPWYLLMIQKHGQDFTNEFFSNVNARRITEAQHLSNDTWYFYPMTLITSMFPWSLFVITSICLLPYYLKRKENTLYLFLTCWIVVVFGLFEAAHSKVANYIFPVFPAIAMLIAGFIYDMQESKILKKIFIGITIGTASIIALFPVAFCVSIFRFSNYITNRMPIFCLIVLLITLVAAAFWFITKSKFIKAIYAFSLVVPVMFFTLLFSHGDFEGYISSEKICNYLMENYKVENTVISSRIFLRGVRYFTDREVAMVDIPGKPFFSRHPIISLNSEEQLKEFLQKQPVTYCILKVSSVKDIENILSKGYRVTLLKIIGNSSAVKVESLP
ncbi:MAG: glycosyltransferase family 39 protein [Candidatus Omnitrophota bacterium]